MRRATVLTGVTVLAMLVLVTASCGRAESQIPGPDAPQPKGELLGRGDSPDEITGRLEVKTGNVTKSLDIEDASEVVVVKNTFGPGASSGWHSHPGPAIVVVASGEFTYVRASDCARFEYRKGQSFVDPGHGNVHIGFNPSETEDAVLYVTFLEVPKGESQTKAAEAPDC